MDNNSIIAGLAAGFAAPMISKMLSKDYSTLSKDIKIMDVALIAAPAALMPEYRNISYVAAAIGGAYLQNYFAGRSGGAKTGPPY